VEDHPIRKKELPELYNVLNKMAGGESSTSAVEDKSDALINGKSVSIMKDEGDIILQDKGQSDKWIY
jgi:hypothetical protein